MALPPWPGQAPAHGDVVLRAFGDDDVDVVRELSTDPCVPLVTSLLAAATEAQALDWIERNRGRRDEGTGFSFAIAEAATGRAVGQVGLWLGELPAGRASAGYLVAPGARGPGRGYEPEGLLRSYQEIGGRRRDMLVVGAVREG